MDPATLVGGMEVGGSENGVGYDLILSFSLLRCLSAFFFFCP